MKFYSLDACIRRRLKTIHIRYCGSHFRLSSLNYADMATADISLRVNHATIYLVPTCLIREILPDLHIYLYSATRIFITSYNMWSVVTSTDDRRKYPSIRIAIFRNESNTMRTPLYRLNCRFSWIYSILTFTCK